MYRRGTVAALLAVSAAYAWWATSLRPFTAPCLWATAAAGAAAGAAGLRWPTRTPAPRRARSRAGAGVWAVLFVTLAGWELASFLQHPRGAHPTLSSMANEVLAHHPVRAVAMVVWLAIGVGIARP